MKDVRGAQDESGPGRRAAFGSVGLLALAVSILVLIWRDSTAMANTGLIALAAVVAGVCLAYFGIFRNRTAGWPRVARTALGILLVTAGVVAIANLSQTTLWLGALVGLLTATLWTIEGAVSFSTWGDAAMMHWSIVLALLSLGAGIGLLFTPAWGAMILWWLLAFSLFVLGAVNVVRAFRLSCLRTSVTELHQDIGDETGGVGGDTSRAYLRDESCRPR